MYTDARELSVSGARHALCDCAGGRAEAEGVVVSACGGLSGGRAEAWAECAGVSDDVPLVVLATVDRDDPESLLRYEKTVSLLYDMREQGARVLALANTGDRTVASLATHTIVD